MINMAVRLLGQQGSGGFSPADIGNLHAWYDASQITGLSDGEAVSVWPDASGNGRDANGASAPLFKTGILNGKPVVRFDGVDDVLQTGAWTAIAQPNTIFFVGSGIGADNQYAFDGISDGNRHILYAYGGNTIMYGGTDGPTINGQSPDVFIYHMRFDEASSVLHRAGGAAVSGLTIGNEALTGLTIGARFSARSFNDGDIAEIIVYNASLTLEEINDVGGYLSTKYGLTWTEAT